MHDVHQAIGTLGTALGLDGLAFDANGNLTLAIDDTLLINIHQHDAKTIEVWTAIASTADTRDPGVLASLLISNHLGEATGAARLSLTPDRTRIVLCERLQVENLDGHALERRLADFVRRATFWNSPQAFPAAAGSQAAPLVGGDETSFMIRA